MIAGEFTLTWIFLVVSNGSDLFRWWCTTILPADSRNVKIALSSEASLWRWKLWVGLEKEKVMHWMFLKLVARCYTMLWRRRKTRTGAFFLQNTIIPHRTSIGTQVHQVWHHVFTDIQIDNPIHQVEANERNREEDSGIFVDVGRRNASHLLQVLLAVQHGRDLVQHQLIGVVSSVPSALSLLLSPR